MKVGILGGTFDPIHLGHLRTAEEVAQELNLHKVYLIPAASPPHKTREPITDFAHRLAMARLAVGHSAFLEISDMEGRRPGLSYSIETLRELHQILTPSPEIFFIVGTDAFFEVQTWKDYRKLFDYTHFVIIQRAGFQSQNLEPFLSRLGLEIKSSHNSGAWLTPSGKSLIAMNTTLMEISSTCIRNLVAGGKSIRFLVPEAVVEYIIEKELYRYNGKPRQGKIMR